VLRDQAATPDAPAQTGLNGHGADAMSLTEPTSAPPSSGHVTLDPDKKHDPHATRFGSFLKACIKLGRRVPEHRQAHPG
jgi:hypothetical protein